MPANAANRMSIPLAAGKALRFFMSEGRKCPATAEIRNTMSNVDLSLRLQRANSSLTLVVLFTGTATAGTFKMKFRGKETAAIAWIASDATFLANIKAALEALDTMKAYNVLVTGTPDTTFTVRLTPKGPTGTFGGTYTLLHPLDQSNAKEALTVSDFSALTGVTAVAYTESTWVNVDPDGYNAAIVVKPYGKKVVAWGQGADENDQTNLLGPYFRINCTAGEGLMEFSPSDETLNVVRI